ncbi:MAG: hypothetical protein JO171_18130 [Paludibacterium sp.]|uniref:amino acid kinase family protein n=1 Tax=Paludibacterium sp. TaxID=1917523 RepID=UPI0025D4B689|nr:hypothetical protein [Paludibacterium sp.]MBV8049074.1 hypothetical protein [Paludibacterium sp.]MBV8649416.1 hypothetical protein [Paludibacterium sp.]
MSRILRAPPPLETGCAVVKLGGGLITVDGADGPRADRVLLLERARELAAAGRPLVLVHGTGAFGKPPARHYGYLDGRLARGRADVVARVSRDLARLELDVVDCLEQGGLRPLRLPALALFSAQNGLAAALDCRMVADLLRHGITPVIGGNFVLDGEGFAVCSSDIIAVDVALALRAACLVLATRARGVYRDYGQSEAIYPQLTPEDGEALAGIGRAGLDVSGGMRAKVVNGLRAAGHGIATFVVDGRLPGNLAKTLSGAPDSGTRLLASAGIGG